MINVKRFLCSLFKRKPALKRVELRFVSYRCANELMESESGWRIAPEEDHNKLYGMVFIEKVE